MRPLVITFILVTTLLPMSESYPSENPILTREEAAELVVSELLGTRADSVFLFVRYETVSPGEEIADLKGTVFTAPSTGWVAFLDDHPTANWEHPCRCIFIDYLTGDYQVYDRLTPPESLGSYWPYPTEALRRFSEADFRIVAPPLPPANMRWSPGEKYAVIINGGANKWMNYVRYWNDVQFIYITLTGVYQFRKENVFVLFSDGLSDSADMNIGYGMPVDSAEDFDEDGVPDIDGPSTLSSVESVFELLPGQMRINDKLLVYMTDHEGTYGGWNTYAYLGRGHPDRRSLPGSPPRTHALPDYDGSRAVLQRSLHGRCALQ
jgi:hypothetical protein